MDGEARAARVHACGCPPLHPLLSSAPQLRHYTWLRDAYMLSSRGRFRVTAKLVRQPQRRLVRLSCFTTLAKDSLSSALVSGTFLYKDPDTQVGGEWGAGGGSLDRSWGAGAQRLRLRQCCAAGQRASVSQLPHRNAPPPCTHLNLAINGCRRSGWSRWMWPPCCVGWTVWRSRPSSGSAASEPPPCCCAQFGPTAAQLTGGWAAVCTSFCLLQRCALQRLDAPLILHAVVCLPSKRLLCNRPAFHPAWQHIQPEHAAPHPHRAAV